MSELPKVMVRVRGSNGDTSVQGLLNKKPSDRLDWPDLLDHPFVRETEEERLSRETSLASAAARAEASQAWKGEDGAVAGAPVYAGTSSPVCWPVNSISAL